MRWRGAVSLMWWLSSWAALDDITTDNATGAFVPENTVLVLAGLWFVALAAWLLATRRWLAGIFSLLAVAVGIAAFWSLPHHYQPLSLLNHLGYVPVAWFLGMSGWLLVARRRAALAGPAGRTGDLPLTS